MQSSQVAGLSGSVPRWASGNLDAPAASSEPAPALFPQPTPINADVSPSAMSAAMSSIEQASQQQQQQVGLATAAPSLQ